MTKTAIFLMALLAGTPSAYGEQAIDLGELLPLPENLLETRESNRVTAADATDRVFSVFGTYYASDSTCRFDSKETAFGCTVAIAPGALRLATRAWKVIAIGKCAGASLRSAKNALLIGDYTSAPEGSDGFVNLRNFRCFWRETGEPAVCPPPEPECRR